MYLFIFGRHCYLSVNISLYHLASFCCGCIQFLDQTHTCVVQIIFIWVIWGEPVIRSLWVCSTTCTLITHTSNSCFIHEEFPLTVQLFDAQDPASPTLIQQRLVWLIDWYMKVWVALKDHLLHGDHQFISLSLSLSIYLSIARERSSSHLRGSLSSVSRRREKRKRERKNTRRKSEKTLSLYSLPHLSSSLSLAPLSLYLSPLSLTHTHEQKQHQNKNLVTSCFY